MSHKGVIYIHPGLGKTATSSIQNIAYTQLVGDVLYFPYGLKGDVHNLLADVHPFFDLDFYNEEIKKISNLDMSKGYLISSEFLCYSSKEHIELLCKTIISAGFKIRIIFAIRELLPLIKSSYLQSLKSTYGLVHGESITDFYHRNRQHLDYDSLIDKWGRLDDVEVYIIDYDKYKDTFVKEFFKFLGVEVEGSESVTNSSIHSIFIDLITAIDRSISEISPEDRSELIDLLLKLSDKYRGRIIDNENVMNDFILDISSHNNIEMLQSKYHFI